MKREWRTRSGGRLVAVVVPFVRMSLYLSECAGGHEWLVTQAAAGEGARFWAVAEALIEMTGASEVWEAFETQGEEVREADAEVREIA